MGCCRTERDQTAWCMRVQVREVIAEGGVQGGHALLLDRGCRQGIVDALADHRANHESCAVHIAQVAQHRDAGGVGGQGQLGRGHRF